MADLGLFKRREDVKKEILKLHEKNNWYLGRSRNIRCVSVFGLSPLSVFFRALIFVLIFACRERGRYDKITYSSS